MSMDITHLNKSFWGFSSFERVRPKSLNIAVLGFYLGVEFLGYVVFVTSVLAGDATLSSKVVVPTFGTVRLQYNFSY